MSYETFDCIQTLVFQHGQNHYNLAFNNLKLLVKLVKHVKHQNLVKLVKHQKHFLEIEPNSKKPKPKHSKKPKNSNYCNYDDFIN